jgi:hypothetical protein
MYRSIYLTEAGAGIHVPESGIIDFIIMSRKCHDFELNHS